MFGKTIKRTIATIAAVTMTLSALSATLSVSAETGAYATAVTTADALANIKYSDTLVPLQTAYNAAQLTTTYSYNGDIAVKDGGDITFRLGGFDPSEFDEGAFTRAVVTVKSAGTTATITLVSDEDLEDEEKYVYYSEELEKLCSTAVDNTLTINIKDMSETLTTLIRNNNRLTVGTVPTATGMLWDDTTTAWTVNKARIIDSCTVTLVAEDPTENVPAKKALSALAETMEAVTLTIGGDVREYTITDNKLYVAGKYDNAYPAASLTGDALTQKTMLESITAYADFVHYIDACDAKGHTITRDNAGITDYVKNYLVLIAYRDSLRSKADNALTDYWYDSWTETTPTGADVTGGPLAGAYNTTPGNIVVKDIRDASNANDFRTLRTTATASNGCLNTYLVNRGYPAVVTDSTYGYADAVDYTTINTYAQLTTALTNVSNKLATLSKLANVATNTLGGIVNTSNKATAVSEARPYTMAANAWVNVGSMYCTDSGYPVLAQLNTLIGDNRGAKIRFVVDPATVKTTKATNTGAFNTSVSIAGAARVRVNGLYATNLSAVATYDSTNHCYEFDWDAIIGDAPAAWMLELATYDSVGLTSIDVRIPDQEAYLKAIGADKTEEDDTKGENLEEDTTNTSSDKTDSTDNNKNEINYGEGSKQDSDEIEETPAETTAATTVTTKPETTAETTTATSDDAFDNIVTVPVNGNGTDTKDTTDKNDGNPPTGEAGTACASALLGLGAVATAIRKRLK